MGRWKKNQMVITCYYLYSKEIYLIIRRRWNMLLSVVGGGCNMFPFCLSGWMIEKGSCKRRLRSIREKELITTSQKIYFNIVLLKEIIS